MIVPECPPHTCSPAIAIQLCASVALSVFIGGLAAAAVIGMLRDLRNRHLRTMHKTHKETP